MKLKKYELVRAIDKVKSVVQKNPQRPALGGVLIKEGYVIAANNEITIQVKVEGAGNIRGVRCHHTPCGQRVP